MVRLLRIAFADALCHVTSRGDGREAIHGGGDDRRMFLGVVGEVFERLNWAVHAYCLVDNHDHLPVETPNRNPSQGMRPLNGGYTRRFNRAHGRGGCAAHGTGRGAATGSSWPRRRTGPVRGSGSRAGCTWAPMRS